MVIWIVKPPSDYQLLRRSCPPARLPTLTTIIVDSLSVSFQLDFVVHDAREGIRRRRSRLKKWIGYDASWQSERTHDAQLIVWAVLADGIGNRMPFAGFLPAATRHMQRQVNKWLACLIHAFLSFYFMFSLQCAHSIVNCALRCAKNGLHHSVLRAIIRWFTKKIKENGALYWRIK